MRQYIVISIFSVGMFFTSCGKKDEAKIVYFHGRVAYNCSGQPVGQARVDIYKESISSMHGTTIKDFLVTDTTDNDGYYSVTFEVPGSKSFDDSFDDYLVLVYTLSGEIGSTRSDNTSKKVLINVNPYTDTCRIISPNPKAVY